MTMTIDRDHVCTPGNRWPLRDARGVFCCYVCDTCEDARRAQYRADVFDDADYWHDEPIDAD